MQGKTVVVTGGAGFIGSHLVDGLLARGYTVRVIDNLATGRRENIAHVLDKIEFVEDSILNDDALKRVFTGADYVFHEAAIPSVPKSVKNPLASHEANSTGTLKVLLAARDVGVKRVVYATSSSVYGDTKIFPTPETVPPNPLSPYALQKFTGEKYTTLFYKLYGLETVVLRYFNVFGPRQDPNSEYAAVIPKFIRLLKNGPTSLNQLVEVLQKLLGTNVKPLYQDFRVGDIKDSYADASKAERILGFKTNVPFEEGLKRTIPTIS